LNYKQGLWYVSDKSSWHANRVKITTTRGIIWYFYLLRLEFDVDVTMCWVQYTQFSWTNVLWKKVSHDENTHHHKKIDILWQQNFVSKGYKTVGISRKTYSNGAVSVLFFLYQRKITDTITRSKGFSTCWTKNWCYTHVSFRWNKINWKHLICYAHGWISVAIGLSETVMSTNFVFNGHNYLFNQFFMLILMIK
jgi:hypothetical protein